MKNWLKPMTAALLLALVLCLCVPGNAPADVIPDLQAEADGPSSFTVRPGGSVTLKVKAEADKPEGITYRWFREEYDEDADEYYDVPIQDAEEASFQTGPLQETTKYTCAVYEPYGEEAYVYFTVTVDDAAPEDSSFAAAVGETELTVAPGSDLTLQIAVRNAVGDLDIWWSAQGAESIDNQTSETCVLRNLTRSCTAECYVYDEGGNEATVKFRITVDSGFSAAADGPVEMTVAAGETVTLKVAAASCNPDGLSYQWMTLEGYDEEIGNEYADIEGETGPTYTTGRNWDTAKYYCLVRDLYGNQKNVVFTVNVVKSLSVEADGDTELSLQPGGSPVLRVAVLSSVGGVTYSWESPYRGPLEGPDCDSYGLTNVMHNGVVSCLVSDEGGHQEAVTFHIVINNGFSVEADGSPDLYVPSGGKAALKVLTQADNPEGMTFEWQKYIYDDEEGDYTVVIDGAAGPSYETEELWERAEYSCCVTDVYGNTRTIDFTVGIRDSLTVTAAGPTAFSPKPGESVTMRVQAEHGTGELSYRWVSSVEGVIEGAASDTYVLENAAFNDTVTCWVSDEELDQSVRFTITVDSGLALEAAGPTELDVERGGSAVLQASARADTGTVSYRWYIIRGSEEGGYDDLTLIDSAQSAAYTAEDVQQDTRYLCTALDTFGNQKEIVFTVSIADIHTLKAHERQEAACTEPGTEAFWECEVCGNLFSDAEAARQIDAPVVIPAAGHLWNPVEYTWAPDGSSVTASRVCRRDAAHTETETVPVAGLEIISPTDTAAGSAVYTSAEFTGEAFAAQTRETVIPALNSLSVLRLPDQLTAIRDQAFENSDCEAVLIPESCASVGHYAFRGCKKLKYIRVPADLEIPSDALDGCEGVIVDRAD